jgi:sodium/proline symporter
MINIPELVMFGFYLVFLSGIGIYFYTRTKNISEYLLGDRKMGRWVTALSAQASDMSGWLLMGLPGAVYLAGLDAAWIAVGLFVGTYLNWRFVAPKLREMSAEYGSLTLPGFFAERFEDPLGLVKLFSAVVILFFFMIYVSSGLVAAGKLFESMFSVDFQLAVIIGGIVVVTYTFFGGFQAVSWTDLFQGGLMFFAILIVPVFAFFKVGGAGSVADAMTSAGVSMSLLPNGFSSAALLTIVSTMAWGLGYFGQPHILARFMAIRSVSEIKSARQIAMIWVFVSLIGAILIGMISIAMYQGLSNGDEEKVFIYMVRDAFNPWIGGILLAAILSAIMSTIDSQLLVSSSALTEDLFLMFFRRNPSDRERIVIGRFGVIVIAVVAFIFALNPNRTVLGLVAYAWGGFGAVFGPVVLASLYLTHIKWTTVLASMAASVTTLVLWKWLGYDQWLYEIVPAFLINGFWILASNAIRKRLA